MNTDNHDNIDSKIPTIKDLSSETVSSTSPEIKESILEVNKIENVHNLKKQAKEETKNSLDAQKLVRLNFLLERSSIYSKFLADKLEAMKKEKGDQPSQVITTPRSTPLKKKSKKGKNNKENEILMDSRQPKLLSGAILKDYQVDGMEWLVSLYENGLNGILADEMGLGKTIQTIAFITFLMEQGIQGPFLIVVPLSTITNWENEFKRFAPKVNVSMFYGSKDSRQLLKKRCHKNGKLLHNVLITSYEIAMKDRSFLQRFAWKYLVVDEGHRLKNFDCKLSKELKKIGAANRLLLTGTPLHNNINELWALLNFILPDIFDDMTSFIDWFDFTDMNSNNPGTVKINEDQKKKLVSTLHSILKPFLLRRLKTDVERNLPRKREYILNAYLTEEQKKLYAAILDNKIRDYLNKHSKDKQAELELNAGVKRKNNTSNKEKLEILDEDLKVYRDAKHINSMKLLNKAMQLRKVCNHPFIFNAPYDNVTGEYIYDPKDILAYSGKMLLLDKLLKALINKGHRVLIFTQFTQILDIIETYILEVGKYGYCRLDGSVTQDSRQEQINDFNKDESLKVFIISTRAGGLGINLASADTVIFYDSDWNPQMDLQAQDRAHRIGQTKPVIVYRLVTANTIESHLISRANNKRFLEKLIISKDKFKGYGKNSTFEEELNEEFTQLLYNRDYEQVIVKPGDELISQEDLDRIMDRSPEAFEMAEKQLKENNGVVSNAYQIYETTQTEGNQFSLKDISDEV